MWRTHLTIASWTEQQARWAQPAECATSRPEAQTAVRSCAAAEATTRCLSNVSQSASASSNGAAPWSVKTVRTWWTFTRVSLTNDPSDWT